MLKENDKAIYKVDTDDEEVVRVTFARPQDSMVQIFKPSTQEYWWVGREKLTPLKNKELTNENKGTNI